VLGAWAGTLMRAAQHVGEYPRVKPEPSEARVPPPLNAFYASGSNIKSEPGLENVRAHASLRVRVANACGLILS
jgi:hypothetical protein